MLLERLPTPHILAASDSPRVLITWGGLLKYWLHTWHECESAGRVGRQAAKASAPQMSCRNRSSKASFLRSQTKLEVPYCAAMRFTMRPAQPAMTGGRPSGSSRLSVN